MTKSNGVDFQEWFDFLTTQVEVRTGVRFQDKDSVKEDYDNDTDVYDVIQSIVDEYD